MDAQNSHQIFHAIYRLAACRMHSKPPLPNLPYFLALLCSLAPRTTRESAGAGWQPPRKNKKNAHKTTNVCSKIKPTTAVGRRPKYDIIILLLGREKRKTPNKNNNAWGRKLQARRPLPIPLRGTPGRNKLPTILPAVSILCDGENNVQHTFMNQKLTWKTLVLHSSISSPNIALHAGYFRDLRSQTHTKNTSKYDECLTLGTSPAQILPWVSTIRNLRRLPTHPRSLPPYFRIQARSRIYSTFQAFPTQRTQHDVVSGGLPVATCFQKKENVVTHHVVYSTALK